MPIPVLDTVLLAGSFRDQAVRVYERATGQQCVLLSGREEGGSIARGHRHAYYLPQPTLSSGGFLEGFVVRLPGGENGVDQDVLDALLSVTHLLRRDTYPVLIVPKEVRSEPTAQAAHRWRSLTPFLTPLRHRRGRDRTEPVPQMLRALQASAIDTMKLTSAQPRQIIPVFSHVYLASGAAHRPPHHRFTRRAAIAFELKFTNATELPAALGADAHFGLGQFVST